MTNLAHSCAQGVLNFGGGATRKGVHAYMSKRGHTRSNILLIHISKTHSVRAWGAAAAGVHTHVVVLPRALIKIYKYKRQFCEQPNTKGDARFALS